MNRNSKKISKKTEKKYYLLQFQIIDGEHEHTQRGICKKEYIEQAESFGKDFAEQDTNGGHWFTFLDKTTECQFDGVREISKVQAKTLQDLGVVSIIDGTGYIK